MSKECFQVYNVALNKFYSKLDKITSVLEGKKIYIFGTNVPASMIWSYLKTKKIDICGFLDNDITKNNTEYRGKLVYFPDTILKKHDENIVIIIVSGFQDQMVKQIKSYGYSDKNIEIIIDLKKEMNDYSYAKHEKSDNQLDRIGLREYQIGILKYLDKVCKENKLRYYLTFGTLLGAVRHKGYIPWDDDIDVYMPACDIIKLSKILKKEQRYKIITQYEDGIYLGCGCNLMIDTSTISYINQFPFQLSTGVSIDIFSLYGLPNENIDTYIKKVKALEANVLDNMYSAERYEQCLKIFNKFLMEYEYDKCDMVGNVLFAKYLRTIYKKEIFGNGKKLQFENYKFVSPTEYKVVLKKVYDDYMRLPPESERQGLHYTNCYVK